MIVQQRPLEELSPIRTMSTEPVITDPGSVTEVTHRSVKHNVHTESSYHNEYLVLGAGLPVQIASQSVADALDISEWPRVKRNAGIDAKVQASFTNGRATTKEWTFDFFSHVGSVFNSKAHEVLPGTLLEYCISAVDAIASEMTTNKMWDTSGNRAQTSVIPHQYFTGQVWNGGWGIPGAGTSGGRRFMAITPRHLFACGHYQYNVGEKLYWKDINNNIIERTVVRVVNFAKEMYAAGLSSYDMSITLLDSDLPGSITILPVIGPWASGIVSSDATSFSYCHQMAGFALLNNDGHLNPFVTADWADWPASKNPLTYDGISLDRSRVVGVGGYTNFTDLPLSWPSLNLGDKFYHQLRGGDSGSPCVVPCAEGWAYSTHISTGNHPDPDLFNELIDYIDTRHGIATGHTVSVATDPTL